MTWNSWQAVHAEEEERQREEYEQRLHIAEMERYHAEFIYAEYWDVEDRAFQSARGILYQNQFRGKAYAISQAAQAYQRVMNRAGFGCPIDEALDAIKRVVSA